MSEIDDNIAMMNIEVELDVDSLNADEAKALKKKKATEAYRRWYERNKERLSKQRSSRYQNDPAYRDSIKRTREKQRERERKIRDLQGGPKGNVLENRKLRQFKLEHPELGSYVSEFMSVGHLALELDIKTCTVRRWEREGIIPYADFRSDGGHRLYTRDQVEAIREAYEKTIAIRKSSGMMPSLEEFKIEIARSFAKLVLGCLPYRFVKPDTSI